MRRGPFLLLALSLAVLAGCRGAPARPTPTPTALPSVTASPSSPTATLASASAPTAAAVPTQPLPTATLTSAGAPTPTLIEMNPSPELSVLVQSARVDLAQRLTLPADSFTLVKADAVDWPDTSLGCPQPGVMYAQIVTPGFLIVLASGEKQYAYHSDGRRVIYCP